MARSLDRLDAAQMAEAAAQQAQQAISQAMRSRQAAMAQARARERAPERGSARARSRLASMFSSDRTSAQMPPETGEELPEYLALRRGDWGKLRTLSAKDLAEAQKEAVAEDYREMVNTYFLVISQRAKQNN